VQLNISVVDPSHVNITGSVFGEKKSCSREHVQLQQGGTIVLPDVGKAGDCVGDAFTLFGQDPSGLELSYNSSADSISLSFSGASQELTHAACSEASNLQARALSSAYCGKVEGMAKVSVAIVDGSHANVTAEIFSAKKSCNMEQFQVPEAGGKILFPDIDKQEDCVNKAFQEFGQDPDSLDLTYKNTADLIEISLQGTTSELTPAGGGQSTSEMILMI
jgi:hypothetical protein